ncbi:exported hypothetical protein [Candidatus Sulfopaludibacter sp. SbA4]|nr:exported hypothetical protein [Candidatus Sulfopaludibacter sp. SbA4]
MAKPKSPEPPTRSAVFSALSASSALSGFDFLLVFSALISVPLRLRGEFCFFWGALRIPGIKRPY